MAASDHVQQRVADMLGEFPVHRPAVLKLVAGQRLPNAVF